MRRDDQTGIGGRTEPWRPWTEYDVVEAVACVIDERTSSDLNCWAAPRQMIREKGGDDDEYRSACVSGADRVLGWMRWKGF